MVSQSDLDEYVGTSNIKPTIEEDSVNIKFKYWQCVIAGAGLYQGYHIMRAIYEFTDTLITWMLK